MNGKFVMGALLGLALLFGAALWYFQTRAFYHEVSGVSEVTAFGDVFEVSAYRGIDADTSPLKMRACFKVDWDYWPSDEYRDVAEPLIGPGWFDCFDAKAISADIKSGAASAILAEDNVPYGFSRFIAQYEDGRAFMWRQINACGEAQFAGDPLPAACPPPPEN